MAIVEQFDTPEPSWLASDRLENQLKDYVAVSLKLIWQRQAIFLAATLLAALYFDPAKALFCYGSVLFTEVLDLILTRRIRSWEDRDWARGRNLLIWTMVNTFLSAAAISMFVVMIALQEGVGGHFTPLFFLFAAALFAAMNNHQLFPALILRLSIYGVAFLFIASLDLWRVSPPLNSKLWLNFFTVAFVLYFILDCSLVFLRTYRHGVRQLEELRQEHMRTKAAYEIKSKFLATVSHELRTPLTSIKGGLDLVNSGALGPVPESMQSMLGIAGKNSGRLASLIDDLLDLQKIDAREIVFRLQPVNVQKLVIDAVEANHGYADPLGITVETQLPQDTLFIQGDEFRLMQVMANLLSNALKFSEGSDKVIVSAERVGSKVRISVIDKGIGIPDDSKDLVFGQFTQVDSSDQRKAGGTGLGMSITKKIVERLNGKIDYVSELGKGTTFSIEFESIDTSQPGATQ